MTRRFLSLLTALTIVLGLTVVSVSAAPETESAWTELLETTTVQPNGENWFEVKGKSGSFTIPLYTETRLAKIDALIWHQTAERISTASVTVGSSTSNLTVQYVGNNVTRIYGNIPNAYYENLTVTVNKTTTSNCVWEVLSCRVSPLAVMNWNVDGSIWLHYDSSNAKKTPGYFDVDALAQDGTFPYTTPIVVHDWEKYDSISIFGSISSAALLSVRAMVDNVALPFEISYTNSVATGEGGRDYTFSEFKKSNHDYDGGSWDESGYIVSEGDYLSYFEYGGTTLYAITIDLTHIDRTIASKADLMVHFTYVVDGWTPYRFNVAGASGAVYDADTTNVRWWNRFTAFMKSLFPTNTPEGEQFEGEAGEQADEMDNLNDELQNVTRPPIEDVETDIEDYVSSEDIQITKEGLAELMNNQLIVTTLMISLTISLVAYILYGKR